MSSINVQVLRNQNLINVGINSTGPQGQSAYETWLSLGNTGTKQDFINSQFDEPTRVLNENTRKQSELARIASENERIAAENIRQQQESSRQQEFEANEITRQTNETVRMSNEEARQEADILRGQTVEAIEQNYAPRLTTVEGQINSLDAEKADKTEINVLATEKATKAEVEVERQRINSFTTLAQGSTTGDAELIDARIGADGKTYVNVGESVRKQISNLTDEIDSYTLHDGVSIDLSKLSPVLGAISALDGTDIEASTRVRTSVFKELSRSKYLYIEPAVGYMFNVMFYSNDSVNNYIGEAGHSIGHWIKIPTYIRVDEKYARFTIAKIDGSVLTATDIVNNLSIYSYNLEYYQKFVNDKQTSIIDKSDYAIEHYMGYSSGSIDSNGALVSATTQIVNHTFYPIDNASKIALFPDEGYQVNAFIYSDNNESSFVKSISYVSNETYIDVGESNCKYLRLIIKKTSENIIYPADAIHVTVGVVYKNGMSKLKTDSKKIVSCYPAYNSILQPVSDFTNLQNLTLVRSGKNLLILDLFENKVGKTINGITFTVNADGTITANGTAIANADFYFRKSGSPTISHYGQPLYFSGCPEGASSSTFFIYSSLSGDRENSIITLDVGAMFIRIISGYTANNLVFSPQLEMGIEKTYFEKGVGDVYSIDMGGIASGKYDWSNGIYTSTVGTEYKFNSTTIKALDGVNIIYGNAGDIDVSYIAGTLGTLDAANKNLYDEVNKNRIYKKRLISGNTHKALECQAHRGKIDTAPENTIHAFRAAVTAGFDTIESDIWFTTDSVPVMIHDSTVNRTSNGTGNVIDFSYEQVYALDFGSWFSAEFTGTKIITFEEFLQFCKATGRKINVEIKDATATDAEIKSVVDLIYKYGMEQECVIGGADGSSYKNLFVVAKYDSYIELGVILGSTITTAKINMVLALRTGKNIVNISSTTYTSAEIELCKNAKIPLGVYLIDTVEDALALDEYISFTISNSLNPNTAIYNNAMGIS